MIFLLIFKFLSSSLSYSAKNYFYPFLHLFQTLNYFNNLMTEHFLGRTLKTESIRSRKPNSTMKKQERRGKDRLRSWVWKWHLDSSSSSLISPRSSASASTGVRFWKTWSPIRRSDPSPPASSLSQSASFSSSDRPWLSAGNWKL